MITILLPISSLAAGSDILGGIIAKTNFGGHIVLLPAINFDQFYNFY